MAWTQLKNAINNAIKANNNQEITGSVLNSVLNSIVNSMGKYATFAGVATPSTNPGVFEGPVVYFANTAGTYPNFNNIIVGANKIVVLYNINGSWDSYEIGDNNITTSRIADKAVTTEKLADKAVTTEKLAENSVFTINLAPSSVGYEQLISNAVDTAIIKNKAVTSNKLADSAMSQAMTDAINAEAEARDIAINNEAQTRAKNDENLNKAIVAETARAKAAEEANTQAIAKRGIYDVSAYNDGAVFESLSALLNNANLSTLIPTSVRCGGMSIRFIHSSDNKYVQYMLTLSTFKTAQFTDVANWQEDIGATAFNKRTCLFPFGIKKALNKSGNIVNTSPETFTVSPFIKVVEGETVRCAGYSGGQQYDISLLCTYDEDKHFLNAYGNDAELGGFATLELVIPVGVSYIVVCSREYLIEQSYIDCRVLTKIYDYLTTLDKNITPLMGDITNIKNTIGFLDIEQPTTDDVLSGKYIYVDGRWFEMAEAKYLMIDVSAYRGFTLQDINEESTDSQYAFVVSYDNTSAVLSGGRIESRFTSVVIPNDANYLYLFFGGEVVLPTLHILEAHNCLVNDVDVLKGQMVDVESRLEDIEICFEDKSIRDDETITESSQGLTSYPGKYCSYTEPFLRELGNYNSWSFIVPYDCKIFTEDSNARFLGIFNSGEISSENYVTRLESPLPSSENPYAVTQGQLVVVTVDGSSSFSVKLRKELLKKALTDNVVLGNSQLEQINEQVVFNEMNDMFVKKAATSLDIYRKIGTSPYYVNFHYEKRYKIFTENEYPSFYDNWGLNGSKIVSIQNGKISEILTQLYGSEAELAVNVPDGLGGVHYVGGMEHGFDNIMTDGSGNRCFRILIDNITVDESAVFPLKPAGKITIESREQLCQAYTNTNPFAEVYKKFDYSSKGIFITNKVKLLRSINFSDAHFGMMCLWRRYLGSTSNPYLINKAIANESLFNIYDVDDAWKESGVRGVIATRTYDRTKITEYGELGIGFSLRVVESTIKPNGGMFVWHNNSGVDKIYFDLTGSYSALQDEELSATVEWEVYGKPINPNEA